MSLWMSGFSYDLDVMAINKIYSKGTTFEDTIKQILIDNKREDIEVFVWSLQYSYFNRRLFSWRYNYMGFNTKLALSKGWSLYFRYDRTKINSVNFWRYNFSKLYNLSAS